MNGRKQRVAVRHKVVAASALLSLGNSAETRIKDRVGYAAIFAVDDVVRFPVYRASRALDSSTFSALSTAQDAAVLEGA